MVGRLWEEFERFSLRKDKSLAGYESSIEKLQVRRFGTFESV